MDKPFEVLSWASRKLRGTGLKKVPGVGKLYNFLYKSLEPKDGIRLVDVGRFKMYLDMRDVGGITPNLMKRKGYHPLMTSILKDLILDGATCVDVGANVGYFTMIFSELAGPKGSVYAFEPEPKNFRVLERNAPYNCTTQMLAVGNINGEAPLYTSGYNFGGHSMHMRLSESVMTKVTTLDTYLRERPVNFIKIDVEGYEPEVIEGMEETIRLNETLTIILEHMPGEASSLHLVSLERRGFSLYRIDEVDKRIVCLEASSIERTDPKKGVAYNILARR